MRRPRRTTRPARLALGLGVVAVLAFGVVWTFWPEILPWNRTAAGPFDYDRSRPLGAVRGEPDRVGPRIVWPVTYRAHDGAEVPAIFSVPRAVRGPYRCMIVQPGLGARKENERRNLLDNLGVATFTIDARLHGERGSRERASAAARSPTRLAAMMRGTVLDLRRGIDWLEEQRECRLDGVGYVGTSFGGFLGALLAGADERVLAPVLVFAGGDWRAMAESESVLLDEMDDADIDAGLRALADVDPARWVGRIAPRPVLMFNGRQDTIIPPAAAEALHTAARDPKLAVWVDTGHFFSADSGASETIYRQMVQWLARYVLEEPDATADPSAAGGRARARGQRGRPRTTARSGTPRPR